MNNKLDIQGHRGYRGLWPENTLPAFERAIQLGVDTLEMDLAISEDGKVVVSHEPYMNSDICLDPDGNRIPSEQELEHNIYQMPYTLIEQYDCGSIGNPGFPDQTKIAAKKPLLSEVFEMAIGLSGTIKFNLELKSHPDYDNIFTPSPDIFVDAVLDIIDDNKVFERTNLQSFDLRILESVKIQNPKMPVALLIDKDENLQNKLEIMSFKPEILGPYFELLTQENVRHYQSLDYKIIPWTVNNLEDIDRMIKMGVDGIITDFPHRLITK